MSGIEHSENLSNKIDEFNNNVQFLINQKAISGRIACKCFENRYEEFSDISKTYLNSIIRIVGHDVVNSSEFLDCIDENIIFADYGAMYHKNSFNSYYLEIPQFISIFESKFEILKFDELKLK